MAFQSNQDDVPNSFGSGPSQNTGGPFAPLPPSRRQRDTSVQWIAVFVTAIVSIVLVVVVLSIRPSSKYTPAPRSPSTYSQNDCGYRYLSCPTTTRWPR